LDTLKGHRAELGDFMALRRMRHQLGREGLVTFLRAAADTPLRPDRLPAIFEAGIGRGCAGQGRRDPRPLAARTGPAPEEAPAAARRPAEQARRLSRPLSERSGLGLAARRAAFVERDRQKKENARAVVRADPLARRPPVGLRNGAIRNWTDMHLLFNEFPKQR